jgi:hypothetical protein
VNKVVRVALQGQITNTVPWLSRFYLAYTGTAPTNADLNTFNGAVSTTMVTNLIPLMTNNITTVDIESIDLTTPSSGIAITASAHTGSRAGGAIPGDVAAVSSYEILRRYRGGHPRGYWPFGSQTDFSSAEQWSPTAVTAFTNGLNAFFTAVLAAPWSGGGTLTHINVSYYTGFTVVISPTTGRARNVPTLRTTPLQDLVSSLIVRNSFGSQRRRAAFID